MSFKGILVDFGGTLAYIDEVENRRYEEALVSTLKRYGCERNLEDLACVLASIYVSSAEGELRTLQEFWGLVLRKLKISKRPELIENWSSFHLHHLGLVW